MVQEVSVIEGGTRGNRWRTGGIRTTTNSSTSDHGEADRDSLVQ